MKVYDAGSIRNVALVGHSGAGKTQLASTLLFAAGAVSRHGKVDEGTTVTDYDEEEIARKHTLSASLACAEWQKSKINFVDTPGMANFLSEARAALRVCDCALVVVDAVSGAQVSTEKTWSIAEEYEVPRIVVLNRLDRERASMERALATLHETFGRSVIPLQLPVGDEKDFKGVVDLLTMKAFTYSGGKPQEGEIPAALQDQARTAREALIEMVAEADDSLMEKFFEAGTLSQEDLQAGLKRAVLARRVYPLVCASATENVGSHTLLDTIVSLAPSPAERPLKGVTIKGGEEVEIPATDSAPAALFVWKTMADPFAGRITMFRVLSGTVKSDATLQNLTRDTQERLGNLLVLQGKTQATVPEMKAGDLGAVAKLKETVTSDTLGDRGATATLPAITFPEPVLSYAIEPKSRGDEDKISTSMHRLQEEDPTIGYTRDAQTKQLLLSGQGQMHIEVTVAKLKRRFGVEVNVKLPRIPYRETITASTDAHGRHKKQTGGHGQFGDCKITMEPLPRGAEFEFVDEIFGGSIPRQFIPAVEKGIQDSRMRGFLAGYPVVDFRVRLTDGQFHQVDSNEMSFKMAGSLAFKDAMSRARPTLLEPIMDVEVYAPSDYAGDLMGDINGRRGRVQGMDQRGSMTVIRAQVPMSEMLTYEQQLTSSTGGRGSYHMEYSHYEEVPAHLHAKIIAAAKAEKGQEETEEV
jgi:elongation factor G